MPHQCTNCSSIFPDGSKEMLSGCPHCGGNTFQYIPKGADLEDYEPESKEPPDPPIAEDSVTGRVGRAASTVREYVNARSEADSAEADLEDDAESVSKERSVESGQPTAETSEQPTAEPVKSDAESLEEPKSLEDSAQASARGEVASLSELTSSSPSEKTPSRSSAASPTDSDTRTETESGRTETKSSRTGTESDRSEKRGPPRKDGRVVDEPDEAANTDLETLRAELNDQFESIRIVEPGQYELNLMELYDREEHIIALREDGKYKIEVPDSWREGDDAK